MIHLDDMLTVEQAAPWLQLAIPELRAKSRGRRSPIPAFRLNCRVIRYNPRIIIAKLANDAGVLPEVIMASMGIKR